MPSKIKRPAPSKAIMYLPIKSVPICCGESVLKAALVTGQAGRHSSRPTRTTLTEMPSHAAQGRAGVTMLMSIPPMSISSVSP